MVPKVVGSNPIFHPEINVEQMTEMSSALFL